MRYVVLLSPLDSTQGHHVCTRARTHVHTHTRAPTPRVFFLSQHSGSYSLILSNLRSTSAANDPSLALLPLCNVACSSQRRLSWLQNRQAPSPPQPPGLSAMASQHSWASSPPGRSAPGLSTFLANLGFHTFSKDKCLLLLTPKANGSAGPVRPLTTS